MSFWLQYYRWTLGGLEPQFNSVYHWRCWFYSFVFRGYDNYRKSNSYVCDKWCVMNSWYSRLTHVLPFFSFACTQLSLEELKVREPCSLNSFIAFKDHSTVKSINSRSLEYLFCSSTVSVSREDNLVERSSAKGARLCRESEFQDCGSVCFVYMCGLVCDLCWGQENKKSPRCAFPWFGGLRQKRLLLSCCIILITLHICLHLVWPNKQSAMPPPAFLTHSAILTSIPLSTVNKTLHLCPIQQLG